ncbi:MAG TPA: glutamate synthase subunit alpha, partial [Verrucomicrobiae bacterium]|nr:glutamate synthase subunit alpha [Verrucomicrobiae bacterium]
NDLIGRADLLDMRKGIQHWKANGLDFSKIFHQPAMPRETARYHCEHQDHGLDKALDHRLIELAKPALARGEKVQIEMPVRNVNRTVGAMLSGEVSKKYGHAGLADDTIGIRFAGSAGQSFGAFLAHGITLELLGEANDYVGKGLSGGHIIVKPSPKFRGRSNENIIVGNTVMYGAISGEAYFQGVAGERFCVRNSGALAIVEGVGDHGCEYMTGGTVVVLGRTGRNFAAGMSGGIAYVFDAEGSFVQRCNPEMVALEPVLTEAEQEAKVARDVWHRGLADEVILRRGIESYLRHTGSVLAAHILEDWPQMRLKFVKVFPHEYKRALGELARKDQKVAA